MGLVEQLAHAWRGAVADVREQAVARGRVAAARRAVVLAALVARELLDMALLVPYAARAALVRRSALHSGRLSVARYSSAPRCLLELYTPGAGAASPPFPAVLFVHGGVWSSGDAWQFAPLAASLADAGVLCAVATYSLHPLAKAPAMAAEVAAALAWLQAHAASLGADPLRVSLLGHSAGAHLAALALLQRAGAREGAPIATAAPPLQLFVALSGVFSVRAHYAYERSRGVHRLSTMAEAMGGEAAFESLSPAALLAASPGLGAWLPPCLVCGSDADTTVPPSQGEDFCAQLRACPCAPPVAELRYGGVTHLQFATAWEKGRQPAEAPLLGLQAARLGAAHAGDVLFALASDQPLRGCTLRAAPPPHAPRGRRARTQPLLARARAAR